jgi:hypothetical protein
VTVPVRAGQYVLGVRASTPELGALVEEAFRSRLVPDSQPPANFSLLSPSPNDWRSRPIRFLFEGHARRLRTTSTRRLLDALWHRLDCYDVRASGSSVLLASTVLIRNGEAHVLPGVARTRTLFKERAWEREGFEVVDRPWVALDPSAGTITVPPSGLKWNGQLQGLLRVVDDNAEHVDAVRRAGRFPIATWTAGFDAATVAVRAVHAAGTSWTSWTTGRNWSVSWQHS